MSRATAAGAAILLAVLAAGCSGDGSPPSPAAAAAAASSRAAPSEAPAQGTAEENADAVFPAGAAAPRLSRSDTGRPRRTWLDVPAIGLDRLRVVAYRGTADDLPGTRIQDRGLAASPRGPEGGIGPGEVGNMVVTAHRTTAGKPFGRLPSLRRGEHVLVESGGLVFDYRVTRTLRVSFRLPSSRALQSAPVPGRPGLRASRPMITLSTCATPEDRAAGNYWSDALGNPEHRIDKVGVLVDVRPA